MGHIHEKIDFTVEVFVVYKEKVLLRKHDKYGMWLSVGGHIELNEDSNEAAIREVKEEVGLDVELFDTREYCGDEDHVELIAPISLNRHYITEEHEHVTLVYFASALNDKIVPENPQDEWKWCTSEEITALSGLRGDIAFYGKKAIDVVSQL